VAIFQWGWFPDLFGVENPGPILSFLPILLMAVLFGLAMDYEVFLVSGMREEFVRTKDARQSIIHGFAHAGRVVTAAALIMFFVFFAFVPDGTGAIKGIAFALAIGVILDAFLVRMTLVPAAMALAGEAAWWLPRWLGRLLPNVDIEGEGLRQHLHDSRWAADQTAAITADDVVFGRDTARFGPLSLSIPTGALVRLTGTTARRRVFAATLAGRLEPVSGRLQILGCALPSERLQAMSRVALADCGEQGNSQGTVGELLMERLRLGQPWYRSGSVGVVAADWISSINRALGARPLVTADSIISSLPGQVRATVLVAATLCERPGVVFVELGDGLPEPFLGRDLETVLGVLAPSATTVIVGATAFGADNPESTHDRPTQHVDLDGLFDDGLFDDDPRQLTDSLDGKALRR
jgi:RND superfamily putative drug exporter